VIFLLLFFGIILRFYKIDNPIADWHSFRQADTASVAGIYLNNDRIDLLNPKYHDISSVQSGIFNPEGYRYVEFPFYNAVVAFFSKWFFPLVSMEVMGRIVSILSFCGSAILVYLLGGRFMGYLGGILATFFFVFLPFNIYFTRVLLPEPTAVFLGLLGIVSFVYFLDSEKPLPLLISGVFFSLGILVKPFVIFYLFPLIFLVLNKNSNKKIGFRYNSSRYIAFFMVVFLPFVLWRIWIQRHPEGIPFYSWLFNGDRIRFRPSFWRWIFSERIGYLILGVWGVVPFVSGLAKRTSNFFVQWFALGMFMYVSVVATANVRHDYYQTLIIPSLSFVVANGVLNMFSKGLFERSILVFSLVVMFLTSSIKVREFYKINHPEIVFAGVAVDKIVPKNALVIAPYNGDTAFLYQTRRSGWPYLDRPIEELIGNGARYYVSVSFDEQTQSFMKQFKILRQTSDYVILDLSSLSIDD
jgi:hypothetical protein